MTAPAIAAGRFGAGLVLGCALGLFYGFLRPVRLRHRHLADLCFLAALYPTWVFYAFGVCKADLRVGYLCALFMGGIFWECTFGRWLRPLFFRFWLAIYHR